VSYINKVFNYTKDSDCSYEEGKNKYIVSMHTNPEIEYTFTIKKDFLDDDNYPLNKDYTYNFTN
jgi:hypothetical protein